MPSEPLLLDSILWNVPAGVKIKPGGIGFELINQYPFFDFKQDGGVLFQQADVAEGFGDNAGVIRTANDMLEFHNLVDALRYGAYINGFSVTGDFQIRFAFRGEAGTPNFFIGFTDTSYAAMGRDIIVNPPGEGIWMRMRPNGTVSLLESIKAGLLTASSTFTQSALTTLYGVVERSGTDAIVTIYSDESNGEFSNPIATKTIPNTTLATLTSAWLGVSRNLAAGGGTGGRGWFDWFELRLNGQTKYINTSPVVTQGWAPKQVGTIIRTIGNLPTLLPAGTSIDAQYRANGGPWSGLFSSIPLLNVELTTNPVIVTDGIESFDVGLFLNSSGPETPEVFIVEGPDTGFTGGGGAASPVFGGGVISA